ncbi:hypothetical protein Tco_0859745 [Tanacetum coccineum]|uniref:Uncharacterized protein n=1 Tax=Tanacetum coccineum TaxID=301880 RepID=A0ABQ5BFW1_9ASTR
MSSKSAGSKSATKVVEKVWDVNAIIGRYLSMNFVVSNSKSLRVTLWGGLGDVLVERKTKHVGMCAAVLTAMSAKDYNNKLYLSCSSSTIIYDDDDIPCLHELKTENSCVEPTKAALAVDCSQPKEGTLENLLIWARNRKNNGETTRPVVMKSAEKVIPDNMRNGYARHVIGLLTILFLGNATYVS